jgi:hypothetical protein
MGTGKFVGQAGRLQTQAEIHAVVLEAKYFLWENSNFLLLKMFN